MTREELIARLHDEEDNYVERKLAGAANAEEIRKTVVAFANSTPGRFSTAAIAPRHVPLTSTVRAILGGLPRPLNSTALVFPNSEGKHDLRWPEKTFPAAVEAAQIEDFRFHDLRHTFASRLAMEGVDLLTIKDLGGWKTLTMVQRYAHLPPGHRHTAIERLAHRKIEPEEGRASGAE